VQFEMTTSSFAPAPVPATRDNVERIRAYVNALATGGGTDLVPALNASLGLAPDRDRVRIVAFFTDGLIGDNRGVMTAVQKQIGRARLFTFGVGSSTNRFIIDHMARLGRGVSEYVLPGEDPAPVIERFQRRIDRQVVTDVELTVEGGAVTDVGPDPLPDVIGARPTVLLGRYRQPGRATLVLRGRVGGRDWEQRAAVVLPEREKTSAVLPLLWAQQRIDHFLNGNASQDNHDAVRPQVTKLGLEFALVTPFTSFVAVEEKRVVEPGGTVKTVRIPALAPHAMAHFGNAGGAAPEPAE
jgi:Ca-activated chloride channel family protein